MIQCPLSGAPCKVHLCARMLQLAAWLHGFFISQAYVVRTTAEPLVPH